MSALPREKKVYFDPKTGERLVNIYLQGVPEAIYLRLMSDVGAYEECKDLKSALIYRVKKGLGI